MEDFIAILLVIAGLLLRLGIPIAVTAILVVALRRVDQRWQHEAEQGAELEVSQKSMFSMIKCWMTHSCPQESLEKCPAYLENHKPCWQVFRNGYGELRQKCLDCPVFINEPAGIPA